MEDEWLSQLMKTIGARFKRPNTANNAFIPQTVISASDSNPNIVSKPTDFDSNQTNRETKQPKRSFTRRRQKHSSSNAFIPAGSKIHSKHLSNYTFDQYLDRDPPQVTSSCTHSLDDKDVRSMLWNPHIYIDFSKQRIPTALVSSSHFQPGYYSPKLQRRKTFVSDFSKQISRDTAQNRGRSCTVNIPDCSLSRSCSLTAPRRKSAIIWPLPT
jgi:hypothetical protein